VIIQIVLIAGIVGVISAVMLGRASHVGRAGRKALFALFGVFAVVAVVDPELTTDIANAVGVGRGADLLLYLMVIVFLFFALHVYVLFKKQERTIVRLARAMALQEARHEGVMTSVELAELTPTSAPGVPPPASAAKP
jgi:small membrane protein